MKEVDVDHREGPGGSPTPAAAAIRSARSTPTSSSGCSDARLGPVTAANDGQAVEQQPADAPVHVQLVGDRQRRLPDLAVRVT